MGAVRRRTSEVAHVSRVHVMDARVPGDGPCTPQRFDRRPAHVPHAVVGMERGEVPGHVGAEMGRHPPGRGRELRGRVVSARDEQRRELEPYIGLLAQVDERVEDGLDGGEGELAVARGRQKNISGWQRPTKDSS